VINKDNLIHALTREGSLIFAGNIEFATELEKKIQNLETLE
jgi:hypothetical protein